MISSISNSHPQMPMIQTHHTAHKPQDLQSKEEANESPGERLAEAQQSARPSALGQSVDVKL